MTNLAFNFLESEVPDYTLPPLLTAPDGRTITSPGEWFSIQRPRLLELFRREVYGGVPDATVNVSAEALSYTEGALGNNAIRKQVRLAVWNGHRELEIILLIYLPKVASKSPVPVFLGLNFWGNHSIHPDPEILLSSKWIADDPEKGVSDHHATEKALAGQFSLLDSFYTPEGKEHVGFLAGCSGSDGNVEGCHNLVHIAAEYDNSYSIILFHFPLLRI